EFENLVSVGSRLRSLALLKDDGTVDYGLVLEIVSMARNDECLKNAILRFVVQEFREDLRRMLGLSFTGVVFKWTNEFETFKSQVKKRRRVLDPETSAYIREAKLEELPEAVRTTYSIACTVRKLHGPLPALYFLLHTLLGARRTGFLLLWIGPWFIICEPKTHFCHHHYYSVVLFNMLISLGLHPGVYYPLGEEHEKARLIAEMYIREHFKGYREARRLHYMLRDHGYIGQPDEKPYTLKIYHYVDGTVGVDVYDYTGREHKFGVNVDDKPVTNIETWIALPVMHINARNEEIYYDFK
ncbi:MAG: hypothetical protein QXJ97_10675, partial [Desulfurococcaceae archaeon]